MLDVIYSLAAEDTKEAREGRQRLDAELDNYAAQPSGRPDRATWGRLPAQQRAMAAATQIRT
jgi:hypothetical protein